MNKTMKKNLLLSTVACILSFLLFSSNGAWAANQPDNSIAIVDVEKLLAESTLGKQAIERDKNVQQVLQKGMDEISKKIEKEPKDKQQQTLRQAQQALQQKLNQEIQISRSIVLKAILDAVKEWRVKNNGLIVMSRQSLLDAGISLDITDQILVAINAKTVTFPELPTIKFNQEKDDKKTQKGK